MLGESGHSSIGSSRAGSLIIILIVDIIIIVVLVLVLFVVVVVMVVVVVGLSRPIRDRLYHHASLQLGQALINIQQFPGNQYSLPHSPLLVKQMLHLSLPRGDNIPHTLYLTTKTQDANFNILDLLISSL